MDGCVIVEDNSQLMLFVSLEQKRHTHGQYLNCNFIIALKISFFKELFKWLVKRDKAQIF